MGLRRAVTALLVTSVLASGSAWFNVAAQAEGLAYGWPRASSDDVDTVTERFPAPGGFAREPLAPDSFGAWLRNLPLKPVGSPVYLFDGRLKLDQAVHVAVIDINTGKRDLQQCADAIMRLRAEWLLSRKRDIGFNDTSGKRMTYRTAANADRASFDKYLTRVFAYAGTYSLSRELRSRSVDALAPGDVFIKGGFPGHAVLVVDVAVRPDTKDKRFLLMQSFMPAQDMHVLKNPAADGDAWYQLAPGQPLQTPEWTFVPASLRTWAD